MTDSRRWLLSLVAATALAAVCLALPSRRALPALAAPPGASVVPFELLPSNHMVVRLKVNGKGPYSLIFDLGAPVTLLSNRAAEASGVIKGDAPRSFLFAMRGEGKATTVELGDLKAENVPVIVLDHPAVKILGSTFDRPLDGIVGYTFFARYKTTIDYQARQMTFTPVDFQVRDLMKELPDRLMGPRVAQHRVLAPAGVWGMVVSASGNDPSSQGVTIKSVLSGSAAAAAGLQVGDILTTLDGRWTASVIDTYAAAASAGAGKPVPVVVIRGGKELTVMVTPTSGI
jgi:membrane-associated protease RseP (regulator of RpoE activity)